MHLGEEDSSASIFDLFDQRFDNAATPPEELPPPNIVESSMPDFSMFPSEQEPIPIGSTPVASSDSSGFNWSELTKLFETGVKAYTTIQQGENQLEVAKLQAQYASRNPVPYNTPMLPRNPIGGSLPNFFGRPSTLAIPKRDNTMLYFGIGAATLAALFLIMRR